MGYTGVDGGVWAVCHALTVIPVLTRCHQAVDHTPTSLHFNSQAGVDVALFPPSYTTHARTAPHSSSPSPTLPPTHCSSLSYPLPLPIPPPSRPPPSRYMSDQHPPTMMGLMLGLAASAAGSQDLVVSRTLFFHLPAQHPAHFPEIEVPPQVQVSWSGEGVEGREEGLGLKVGTSVLLTPPFTYIHQHPSLSCPPPPPLPPPPTPRAVSQAAALLGVGLVYQGTMPLHHYPDIDPLPLL
jgi:hypothetical protein